MNGLCVRLLISSGEKLSSVVGYKTNKPYIIVLDQVEGSNALGSTMEKLGRGLAYDSADCKGYLTLLVASDVHLAEVVYTWNGGTKISFLGTHEPWTYKWGKLEVNK